MSAHFHERTFFQKKFRLVSPTENDVDRLFFERSLFLGRCMAFVLFRISSKRRIFELFTSQFDIRHS